MRQLLGVLLAFLFLVTPAHADMAVTETMVQVQVQGAVKRPGVYRLLAGSRVAELIAKAGGPRGDAQLSMLNLTQRLEDGQSFYLPTKAEARQQAMPAQQTTASHHTASRSSRSRAASGPINLNTATAAQLQQLPGIGPSLAAAIVRKRRALGRFRTVEDLREVAGIGKKRFERLKALVRV